MNRQMMIVTVMASIEDLIDYGDLVHGDVAIKFFPLLS